MKTDELIAFLANGTIAVEPVGARRLVTGCGWGLAGTILLMALLLGVRPDLANAAHLPMFWAKLLMPALAGGLAFHLLRQLAIPGNRITVAPFALGLLLLIAVAGAAVALAGTPAGERVALVLGSTWKTCVLNITVLSLPLLVAGFLAIRGMAPTRPVLAGGTAGILAGATAAAVYALHCPEMTAPFLGIWYVLGVAVPTAIGAVLGKPLLQW